MTFTRQKENFTCQNCGQEVVGDGYTNHCPNCLWSQHVDIDPGDRQASCGGLMEPTSAQLMRHNFKIAQRCKKCGQLKINRSAPSDNQQILISLSTRPFPK